MFNVIPQMRFSMQKNTPVLNNKFSQTPSNLAPLKADTTSFTGVGKVVEEAANAKPKVIDFVRICGNFFDSSLYLSDNKMTTKLKGTHPEDYMHVLAQNISEVIAKRLDATEILKKAESGSFSHPPYSRSHPGCAYKTESPSTFTFHPKKEHSNKYSMDWSEQYRTLENVFEETGVKSEFSSTKYDFSKAKERLYEELRILGLMQ